MSKKLTYPELLYYAEMASVEELSLLSAETLSELVAFVARRNLKKVVSRLPILYEAAFQVVSLRAGIEPAEASVLASLWEQYRCKILFPLRRSRRWQPYFSSLLLSLFPKPSLFCALMANSRGFCLDCPVKKALKIKLDGLHNTFTYPLLFGGVCVLFHPFYSLTAAAKNASLETVREVGKTLVKLGYFDFFRKFSLNDNRTGGGEK